MFEEAFERFKNFSGVQNSWKDVIRSRGQRRAVAYVGFKIVMTEFK
jgi:hypothetical protein